MGGKYEIHGQAAWHLGAAMIMAVISQRDTKIPTVAGVFLTDLLPIAVVVINDEGVTPIKNR
ncbi:hypothetical protein [Photorhabdus luminescens]|uniref:Uncharacterized protein n=1 Tax=Photorhabdus luminescens subsp. sonorensis TaxID=1173677 RepID=A0A5C4RGB7_PHOLU|nr:hypothetical protein [Photorhabdus luminescens]TNH43066.1 hypothetical protein EP164_13060 [Photorhabdus luminescens subsp. sonorensis]